MSSKQAVRRADRKHPKARFRGIAAAVLMLVGCHSGPVKAPPEIPTPEQLITHLRARQQAVRTLKASARVDYWDQSSGDRVKANASFWVARDQHLRLDLEGPWGPLCTLATDGQTFQLLDARQDAYFVGPATPCALSRAFHLAIPPALLVDALLGDGPLVPYETTRVSWNGEAGRWVLHLEAAGKRLEQIEFVPSTLEVARVEVAGPSGKSLFRIEHESWKNVGGVAMPERSQFWGEESGAKDVVLKMRSQEINLEPPQAAWSIPVPPSLVPQELACGTP